MISHYSTQHIQNASDQDAIAQLGADYLVTGSFRSIKEQIRISVHLIRTKDQKIVFSAQHEELTEAILSAEDVITQQIVNVLQQQIDYDLLSFSYKKERVQLAAYENYLLGMDCLLQGTLEGDLKAREYFEAAVKIDPQYARAYTGLSLSYFNEWSCILWDRWDVSKNGAQEYALKALSLDENDYISLAVVGRTYIWSDEPEKAEHCLRKSIRMNPNDADNLVRVAFSLIFLGYAEEAEQLYLRANKLNPLHQDEYFIYGSNIYFELGQFEKSLELAKKVDASHAWIDFPVYLAATCYHLGKLEEALGHWEEFLLAYKTHIYSGKADPEQEALQWNKNVNPYQMPTKLIPFWNYIEQKENLPSSKSLASENPSVVNAFLAKGDLWELSYQGQRVFLKDAKGLVDIHKLLAQPEEEIHCSELMGTTLEITEGTQTLDQKAKSNYQTKIKELQADIREAEEMNNLEQAARLQTEYEQLIAHLSQSLGLAGKPREVGSTIEKARSAVTWRIRSTIKKIEKVHPALAKHFSQSIKTGTFCAYRPEQTITWTL